MTHENLKRGNLLSADISLTESFINNLNEVENESSLYLIDDKNESECLICTDIKLIEKIKNILHTEYQKQLKQLIDEFEAL
jgi:hypothetical protein